MRKQLLTISAAVAALALGQVGPAGAQRVSADIHIGSWPVAGTIRIGERHPYYEDGYYGRPRRTRDVVVVRRGYPKVIVVERDRGRRFFRPGRAQVIVAFYDRHCGLYFDRYRRGLEEVRLYQHDGRYYPYDRWDEDRRDRRYEEDDRYDRERYRSRDDYDDRYGAWDHDHNR